MPSPVSAPVINIVLQTAVRLLRATIGVDAKVGELRIVKSLPAMPMIHVQMDMLGDRLGPVHWTFQPGIARAIAARMLYSDHPPAFTSEETSDAVAEISNLIAGNAAQLLLDAGMNVMLSPPTATVRLTHEPVQLPVRALEVEVKTSMGDISILISAPFADA